ncbi:hypothetical protein [Actinomadura madurae]|uniref:hypothetical protein n=1 Tax=Actinomadura madurae TaxID=1993 RepID=UPI0035577738
MRYGSSRPSAGSALDGSKPGWSGATRGSRLSPSRRFSTTEPASRSLVRSCSGVSGVGRATGPSSPRIASAPRSLTSRTAPSRIPTASGWFSTLFSVFGRARSESRRDDSTSLRPCPATIRASSGWWGSMSRSCVRSWSPSGSPARSSMSRTRGSSWTCRITSSDARRSGPASSWRGPSSGPGRDAAPSSGPAERAAGAGSSCDRAAGSCQPNGRTGVPSGLGGVAAGVPSWCGGRL